MTINEEEVDYINAIVPSLMNSIANEKIRDLVRINFFEISSYHPIEILVETFSFWDLSENFKNVRSQNEILLTKISMGSLRTRLNSTVNPLTMSI